MKVLQFPVPVAHESSIAVKNEIASHFYNYLHSHKEVQITLILSGNVKLITGNFTHQCQSGDIFFIGADQAHIFRSDLSSPCNKAQAVVHAIHVFVDYKRTLAALMNLPEMTPIRNFLDSTINGLKVPADHVAGISSIMHRIRDSEGLNRLMLLVKLLQFCQKYSLEWESLSAGISIHSLTHFEGARINEVYKYMTQHYSENITLNKIASIACITPHAFCKYFKRHTHKTYLYFLNEIRIHAACKKIVNGDFTSLSQVAYASGFNSLNTFNRVFKKVTSVSPKDYVKKNKVTAQNVSERVFRYILIVFGNDISITISEFF